MKVKDLKEKELIEELNGMLIDLESSLDKDIISKLSCQILSECLQLAQEIRRRA